MEIPPLDPLPEKDVTFIDMHSVLNILNVLQFELMQIEERVGESAEFTSLEAQLFSLVDALADRDRGIKLLSERAAFSVRFLAEMDQLLAKNESPDQAMTASRNNVGNILGILEIRASEYLARCESPQQWVDHSIDALKGNYRDVFAAIEQNAKGAYRIVDNIAEKGVDRYLINFSITSVRGDAIRMPPVFQDIFRDLMANARKYTPLGGEIRGGIHESEDQLRIVVEDTGYGIPSGEIGEVVKFGKRGSNMEGRRTMGGGFGLTKAVYFVHLFGGRIWITSETDAPSGTKIDIHIPMPENESG